MYCGNVREMELDRWSFFSKEKEALLSYMLILGRKMLKILKPNIKIVQKIWVGLLQLSFNLKSTNTRCK